MINSLLSSPTTAMLERTLNFTEQRHQMILANIANVDTPGYRQQDVSVSEFRKSLASALERQHSANNTHTTPEDTDTVSFLDHGSTAVQLKTRAASSAQPFYDRGAHSMEDLMSQLADNAQAHNMAAAFLKGRNDMLQKAITMRP